MKEEIKEIETDWDSFACWNFYDDSSYARRGLDAIPTPAELRERWALEDQRLITLDWEAHLAERRRFGLDRSLAYMYEHGLYQLQKTLRNHNTRKRKERRRALQVKISEDYWGAKLSMSTSTVRGIDFGFIFKE
jgi:hypothetical protein